MLKVKREDYFKERGSLIRVEILSDFNSVTGL